jgi:hypothetical protein
MKSDIFRAGGRAATERKRAKQIKETTQETIIMASYNPCTQLAPSRMSGAMVARRIPVPEVAGSIPVSFRHASFFFRFQRKTFYSVSLECLPSQCVPASKISATVRYYIAIGAHQSASSFFNALPRAVTGLSIGSCVWGGAYSNQSAWRLLGNRIRMQRASALRHARWRCCEAMSCA